MNRIFKNIRAIISCTVVAAMLGSSVVSCSYDDTELRQEIEEIRGELAELKANIESELAALHNLIDGNMMVVGVENNNDGSKVITLSDGTKITVYPKGDKVPANIVTIVDIDGVKYWAMYDGRGNATPITIGGKNVPVSDVAPQTRINGETNAIEISFDGGATWMATGYTKSAADSTIADVEVIYSDWQTDSEGNPLALYCEVTLVDGTVVKLGMQNGKLVLPYDSVFVAYGETMPFSIEVVDAADFMIINPMGWESDVEHNVQQGSMLLNFTAPSVSDVASGVAVAEGVAKFVVVFNNGSSAMASIKLSTTPADVNFTPDGAYVEVSYGVNYLLCGMVAKSEYNAETVARECNAVLGSSASTSGIVQLSFVEQTSKFVSFKELVKGELKAGVEYLFWCVVPRSNDDGDLSVKANEFSTQSHKISSVSLKVTDKSFFDVKIQFDVVGSEPYALGYALASEFDAEELVAYYAENPSYLDAKHKDMSYEGSFVELFADGDVKLESGARYVAWYLAKSDAGKYLVDNLIFWEFSTMAFSERGDIEIKAGEAVCGYDSIEVEFDTDEPHMIIYYKAMPSADATKYADDDSIVNMLIAEGTKVATEGSVIARYDDCEEGEKVTFFAVAVDKAGRIGKSFKAEYTTLSIEYNALVPQLEVVEAVATNTVIKATCEGAKSFKYIYTAAKDSDWTTVYGGSEAAAGEYIVKNPNSSYIHTAADGNIVITNLMAATEYILVVVAVDEAGLTSHPVSVRFTPIANIGEFVYKSSSVWEMGKPEFLQCTSEMFGHDLRIIWYILPQKDCTAYSLAINPVWLEEAGCQTPEDIVNYILANVDQGLHTRNERGRTCEYRADGNYVRTWINQSEDVNGDGVFTIDDMVEMSEDGQPGVYNICPCGTKDETMIYTTWQDQYGNFHEPFVYDPTNKKFVD